MPNTKSPPADILHGVDAIKRELGEEKTRRVYYLLERGYVPGAFKMGATWALSVPKFRRIVHGEGT